MRTLTITLLSILLIGAALLSNGCAMGKHEKFDRTTGKLVEKLEYWRAGDQELTGLDIGKEDPNGVKVWAKVDHQKSEGKLQIESAIAALADLYVKAASGGVVTAGEIEAVKTALTQAIASQ